MKIETQIEGGDPAVDGRAFRRALGQYATGVAVITAGCDGNIAGMTINSFSALSLDPALILWSIRREASTAPVYLSCQHFVVNVLSAEQVAVAQLFSSSHQDRFSQVRWSAGSTGVPLIHGAIARFECRMETVHEGGDHLILVGRVERYARFEGLPLLFAQGQYAVTENHPKLNSMTSAPALPAQQDRATNFMKLLSAANQHTSSQFQASRQGLGFTVASARVLGRLIEGVSDPEALARSTYLGQAAIEDAMADLRKKGLVHAGAGAQPTPTPQGIEKWHALAEHISAFTHQNLAGFADADIETATRVLVGLRDS